MPTKKPTARTFLATVEDRPGVLNRVVSLIRRRGYNIESLAVGTTETPSVSRITLVVRADEDTARRVRASLLKLVDVLRVDDVSNSPSVIHEMALVKVLAPDHQRNEVLRICEAVRARVARALQRLRVDVIEAGFPAASPGDFEAVRAVAREVDGPTVCALARAEKRDIDQVEMALRDARKRRCHVFLATSPLHREHKLRLSREEIALRAEQAVRYAREFFDDVEYSAEDAARTEPDFLAEVVERAVAAGATTINIPDTVGYALPAQFGRLIGPLRNAAP